MVARDDQKGEPKIAPNPSIFPRLRLRQVPPHFSFFPSAHFRGSSQKMPPPDIPVSHFLSILLIFLRIIPSDGIVQRHMDCQANEQFMQCGTCEGSCKEPIVVKCRNECKPPRCECQSKNGFVRAHDGACIPVNECHTYKGAYFGSGGQLVSGKGVVSQTAPKTVLNNFKPVPGGAGFGLLNGAGEGEVEQNGVNGNDLQQPEDLSATPVPPPPPNSAIPTPPSLPLSFAFTKVPSPPSISPPDFQSSQTPPQLVPDQIQFNPESSPPPAIFRHRDNGGGDGNGATISSKPSQMNLFADLSESGGTEPIDEAQRTGQSNNFLQQQQQLPQSPNNPIRPLHQLSPKHHSPSPIQNHFPHPNPPNSPPMLHPIPPASSHQFQQNPPTYPAISPSQKLPSSHISTPLSPPSSNLPKYGAFGVGNQLTIESASGDQGAIIGNVGPAPYKGGGFGNNDRGGGGGGDYDHLKVGGQRSGQQRQQQDLPMAPKCGITRGCKPRGGQNSIGGGVGRENALASVSNWQTARRLKTKNQPYLYAYVNPPIGELDRANANGVLTQNRNNIVFGTRRNLAAENDGGRQFEEGETDPNWTDEEADNVGNTQIRQPSAEDGQKQHSLTVRQQPSSAEQSAPPSLLIPPLPANLRIYRQKRLFRERRRRK